MAVGKIAEELYLVSLPAELTFTVTSLENEKRGDWFSSFETKNGKVNFSPFAVQGGSRIAKSVLSSTSIADSGDGSSNALYFTITGTANGKSINKKGSFRFSSTEWYTLSRPDYTVLTFRFDDGDPMSITQKVPTLMTPDPYYCSFALSGDRIVMVASRENNLGTEVMSNIISGIITAHTKAIGWVFGKLW